MVARSVSSRIYNIFEITSITLQVIGFAGCFLLAYTFKVK